LKIQNGGLETGRRFCLSGAFILSIPKGKACPGLFSPNFEVETADVC